MFNLFKKTNHRDVGQKLAEDAKIESILENGKLGGYTIFIESDKNSFLKAMKHKDSYAAFIGVVEKRIKVKYIDKYSNGANSFAPKEVDVLRVPRIVVTPNFETLIHWSKE
ncbi:MAG: hypothetical protein AB9834_12675 [Lentimicrobium sp.]